MPEENKSIHEQIVDKRKETILSVLNFADERLKAQTTKDNPEMVRAISELLKVIL